MNSPPEAAIKASVHGLVTWALSDLAQFRFMDEIRTLASTDPEFASVRQMLADGQTASAERYGEMLKTGAVRDLPWPVAHSLMLGPAYNYLRLTPADDAPAATATLFADAAWQSVKHDVRICPHKVLRGHCLAAPKDRN